MLTAHERGVCLSAGCIQCWPAIVTVVKPGSPLFLDQGDTQVLGSHELSPLGLLPMIRVPLCRRNFSMCNQHLALPGGHDGSCEGHVRTCTQRDRPSSLFSLSILPCDTSPWEMQIPYRDYRRFCFSAKHRALRRCLRESTGPSWPRPDRKRLVHPMRCPSAEF